MNPIRIRTLSAALLAAFSGVASAAAFQAMEQNASGIGVAFAGSAAVAENASTIFYNPAGLTQLTGFQFSAGASANKSTIQYHTTDGSVGVDGGNAGRTTTVANAYFSFPISRDLIAGFGVSQPFAQSSNYDSNWRGNAAALKTEIKATNYNPSLAYRLNDRVSLGFGVNYQKLDTELTNSVYSFKADDSAWGWNAGALFTLSPAMRVGLAYRSAVSYKLEGNRSGAAATADLKLPDTFTLSVWQQVSDRWEAMGDLSYTNWSTLDTLEIKRAGGTDTEVFKYKDSWRFAWGAAYKASEAWKIKFGIGYERSPVRDANRNARSTDTDALRLAIGAQWNAGQIGKLDVGYAYRYSRDDVVSQTTPAVLSGEYQGRGHLLGVQYSVGF